MIAVIGSGLGGLAAAVRLARAGREVAVFEQHTEPGGFATRFQRGPYTFEASLHALDAVGEGEPNHLLLQRLGLLRHVRLLPLSGGRRERWLRSGLDLTLPRGRGPWIEAMARAFPGDADGAARLMDLAAAVHAELYAWMEQGRAAPGGAAGRLLGLTARQVVDAHFSHPEAWRLFTSLTSYLGLGPDRLAALPFLVILNGYIALHAAFPEGGSHSLVQGLLAELADAGGRLHLGVRVRGIACRRRRVQAVDVGEPLPVEAVVSNVSPRITYGELLPADALPRGLRDRVLAMQTSPSMACLHLGLRDAEGLRLDHHESFLHEIEHPLVPCGRLSMTARHLIDPGLCPPGHGVVEVATRGANQDDEASACPELAEALLELADAHLAPGLRARVEARSFVHPGTWVRYTGTPGASVFGFAMTPAQGGLRALPPDGPIEGLVHAGAWVRPGVGQTAAMLSGWMAAGSLLSAPGRR